MIATDPKSERPAPLYRARAAVGRALHACADLVVPPCCLVCRTRIGAHHLLCPICWRDVRFIRPPLCDVLGIPLPFDTGERMVSAAAVAHPPAYDRARAVAHFTGSMRTLVHQFKYADRHDGQTLFGRWLADAATDLRSGLDIIVPVPLSRLNCCCVISTRRPCWPAPCRGRSACRWTPCCSNAHGGPGAKSA